MAWEGVTVPKAAPPTVRFGPLNQGVLVMLKDSARNSTFIRSVTTNFLKIDRGRFHWLRLR